MDQTHDPSLRSWVEGADSHADFPIQNLPLGVFSPPSGGPRAGVAIGDFILDLGAAGLDVPVPLNDFLAQGAAARRALRARVSALLASGAAPRPEWLHRQADCRMHLPARIGDYTDFYVGIHHAVAAGRLFRPDNPLLPNYKHIPVGYHGRASSVVPSGIAIRRPSGQRARPEGPSFGPAERLDFELELGLWVGRGNEMGEPIPIARAAEHIAGYCLLNDWSARDIQAWEYQPLGPFLGKSFGTTISPWIITPEALEPFRIPQDPREPGDPKPLPYLWDEADQSSGALALELEAFLVTPSLREKGLPPHRITLSHGRHLYWTPAQMVAHHSSNGCNLQPGDLIGTGTVSGPDRSGYASLLEVTSGGREPLTLASGETRTFLQDGDEIVLAARARREGTVSIGFGPCVGRVTPAPA
ncbi:fumarylacetoacetase [Sabulicella rubraurantiaca]|uniref:fumarylacetoacetase n=1 Tax=Sabulicella rubraurantiaca TaxID=2811429 RepID=UPI001A96F431|nr:fumarylacetoacetase [Sabulicella rubraurantiaca]